jgi:hypothetical protein
VTATYGAHAAREDVLAAATMADNVRVWDGRATGHYEVWYLTLNHVASRTGFWIRYTLESPLPGHGEPYAQLWFAAFDHADPSRTFALNRKFPIAAMRAEAAPFALDIGDGARLTHGSASGAIAGAGHEARWSLTWLPADRTYRQLPDVIYRTRFGDTKVLTPNLDVPIRGTIDIDGRHLVLDGEPGGQTHLWGRKHAHAWAWGHCNAFEGHRGAALEALTVRLKRRGVVTPPLTVLGLRLDGEELAWNQFHHTPFTRGHFGTGSYRFSAIAPDARLEGEYTCRPEDLVLTEYTDPDGEPSYCANTEVADLRVTVYRRTAISLSRFREAARLHAPGTGHFEVAGRSPDAAVTNRHVTLP